MDEEKKTISIRELREMITRDEGMSDLEFEAIKDLEILDGKITAGQYINELQSGNILSYVTHENGIYRYEGIQIGVRISKNENIPSGFMNPKAHKEFINNIFETSPYSSD